MHEKQSCNAFVVHCIDFRFRKVFRDFLNAKFGDSYDLASAAGGVKNLDFVLEQAKISNALHRPEVFVLIQHEDCGAYGGSKAFGDFSKEQEFQKSELQRAEQILKQQFPQPIEKYLARFSGEMLEISSVAR